MLKKSIIACVLLLCSSTFAFQGSPYIGAGAGSNHQMFEMSPDDSSGSTFDFGGTGVLFNANLGYGGLVNQKFYLAGELLANVTTGDIEGVDIDNDMTSVTLKFRTKYTYGLSLIPGYMLSEKTMIYGRVGVVRTRFDVKETYDVKPLDFLPTEESEHSTVTGGQFGLGMQTKLTNNLDLRGEYVYSAYQTLNNLDSNIDPSSGQATVGLVYKFR